MMQPACIARAEEVKELSSLFAMPTSVQTFVRNAEHRLIALYLVNQIDLTSFYHYLHKFLTLVYSYSKLSRYKRTTVFPMLW